MFCERLICLCSVTDMFCRYRLCPANHTLDEECFQRTPLRFVGQQSMRWGGVGGKQIFYNGTYVSEGTVPSGSIWSKLPIPRAPWQWDSCIGGMSFEPRCDESPECANATGNGKGDNGPNGAPDGTMLCKCSGRDLPALEIVDRVAVPANLPAGEYVLGWYVHAVRGCRERSLC